MRNQLAKILFGLVIFFFSAALAYFTANYLSENKLFDYWGALAVFACIYVVVGSIVAMIFPISIGFLCAADILILRLLGEYYGQWADALKLLVVGAVLVILYGVSALVFKDHSAVRGAAASVDSS